MLDSWKRLSVAMEHRILGDANLLYFLLLLTVDLSPSLPSTPCVGLVGVLPLVLEALVALLGELGKGELLST
jgi:hypothetical protein